MTPPLSHLRSIKSVEARTLHITVGINEGHFRGNDHFAIQGAVDYVARRGGGVVELLPGRYLLRNAIQLADAVTLRGSGSQTILEKPASQTVKLSEDADGCRWYVDVADSSAFQVGDGITIHSNNIDGGEGRQCSIQSIMAIEGNRIFLDALAGAAHWVDNDAAITSIHSLIEARYAKNVVIENLAIEGNKDNNEALDGNYAAAVFLRYTENVEMRGLVVSNFNGDGLSWQNSHDMTVEDCVIDNCSALGLHPGNGSQRPQMRNNRISRCRYGIYWCWDVNHGIAENNYIADCNEHGITTGHRDTDNIIRANTVVNCKIAGIFFRPERTPQKTAHRTLVEGNDVQCPRDIPEAIGISVVRGVEDVVIRHNKITIAAANKDKAIVIDPAAVRPVVEQNEIVTN